MPYKECYKNDPSKEKSSLTNLLHCRDQNLTTFKTKALFRGEFTRQESLKPVNKRFM